MKDKFAIFGLIKVLYLRGQNCLQTSIFTSKKCPALTNPRKIKPCSAI